MTIRWERWLGLTLGLLGAIAVVVAGGMPAPAQAGRATARVTLAPVAELDVVPAGTVLVVGHADDGAAPATATVTLRNLMGVTARVRLRMREGQAASPLRVALRAGGAPVVPDDSLAPGAWSQAAIILRPGERTSVDVTAWAIRPVVAADEPAVVELLVEPAR